MAKQQNADDDDDDDCGGSGGGKNSVMFMFYYYLPQKNQRQQLPVSGIDGGNDDGGVNMPHQQSPTLLYNNHIPFQLNQLQPMMSKYKH